MIADLKPYPKMKDSGVPWLGKVPAHWNEQRAKYFFREVDARSTTGAEELLSVSHKTGVTPRSQKTVTMFLAESTVGHKLCRPGDMVVNTMWAWMAAMGVAKEIGLVSPSYGVYRPRGTAFMPEFLDHLIRTPAYTSEYVVRSTGVTASRLRLYPEQMLRIPFVCPPVDEQSAIVRFLNNIDRRIRRYIRAKQKLIKLLEEQKQAIIHRAVTRGLDPAVALKPSGILWLGDIPRHWTLRRFKFVATVNSGQVDPREPAYRDLILIAPNHVQSGTGHLLQLQSAHAQGADSGKYLVRNGQVIYSKIRPNLRKAAIAPVDCLCSADMYPIEPRSNELLPNYLLLLLLSDPFTRFAVDASMRVAMPKVNREALADCVMWYPDSAEQEQILNFVSRQSAPIDTARARTENEIALVREFRTRLIADVVTGKLDVREAAAKLPAESEPTDDAEPIEEEGAEAVDEDEPQEEIGEPANDE